MVVRELVTKLGFQTDMKGIAKYQQSMKKAIGTIARGAAIAGAAISAMTIKFLQMGGEAEQVDIAFTTMLKSAEKSKELQKDIAEFAATTPFSRLELINYAKQMIAVGYEQKDIIDSLTDMGNVAAGVGKDKLPTMVLALGKIKTRGRASMRELNMLLLAGVPILDQLAKNFGKTKAEIFKMVSKGEVGFDAVNKAMKDMSTGSGKFAKLMVRQSSSLLGMWSNLQDSVEMITVEIGQGLLPEGKSLLTFISEWISENKELIKGKIIKFLKKIIIGIKKMGEVLKKLTPTFKRIGKVIGTSFKALKGFFDIMWKLRYIITPIVAGLLAYVVVMKTIKIITAAWTIIQWLLNIAMTANPIGLIIAAVVALIVIVVLLVKNWDKIVIWFKKIWEKILVWFDKAKKKIIGFFLGIWKKIKKFFKVLKQIPRKLIKAFLNSKLGNILKKHPIILLFNLIKNNWGTIVEFFKSLWASVILVFKSVGEFFKNFWTDIIGAIVGAFQGFVNFVTGIFEWIAGIMGKVKEFFGKFGGKKGGMAMSQTISSDLLLKPFESKTAQDVNNKRKGGGNNINVKSDVVVQVPQGTSAQQQTFLKNEAKKIVQKEFGKMTDDVNANSRRSYGWE